MVCGSDGSRECDGLESGRTTGQSQCDAVPHQPHMVPQLRGLGVAVKNRKRKAVARTSKQIKQTASVYLVQRKSQNVKRVSCLLDVPLSSSTPLSPSKA